jgi:hypothetical protein
MTIRTMAGVPVNGKPARSGYVWRDPRRVSSGQRAGLEEKFDAPDVSRARRRSGREDRIERFSQLRSEGMTVEEASAVVGVRLKSGRGYERERMRKAALAGAEQPH